MYRRRAQDSVASEMWQRLFKRWQLLRDAIPDACGGDEVDITDEGITISICGLIKRRSSNSSDTKDGKSGRPPLLRSFTMPTVFPHRHSVPQCLDRNSCPLHRSSASSEGVTPDHSPSHPRRGKRVKRRRSLPRVSFASDCTSKQNDSSGDSEPDSGAEHATGSSAAALSKSPGKQRLQVNVMMDPEDQENRGGLMRLARKLSHREKKDIEKTNRTRAFSADFGTLRKTASVDSIHQVPEIKCDHLEISPNVQIKFNKKLLIPSSPSMPSRLYRSRSAKRRTSGDDAKSERRRSSNRSSCDMHALFDAVEKEDLEAAKGVLEASGNVDINWMNSSNLTVLDIAILTNQKPLARILIANGARENLRFVGKSRALDLSQLIKDAEEKTNDLTNAMLNTTPGSAALIKVREIEKSIDYWEWRAEIAKKMKANYDHANPPDPPVNVQLTVSGTDSILVTFSEPEDCNGALVTWYKVEWSLDEEFSRLAGESRITDPTMQEYEIRNLNKGEKYYVRVYAGNMKGLGMPQTSSPEYIEPSCWHDLDGSTSRLETSLTEMDELLVQLQEFRQNHHTEQQFKETNVSPSVRRKSNMRKSLKNIFSNTTKFQKHLRRGMYLASVLYCEDKVVVTSEDVLPIVEVDDSFSGSTHSDFHWMMKVACTWEDVRQLRQDMDRSSCSSAIHFRSKLLQAASHLQHALNVQDLGMLYYRPIKDGSGTVVIVTINSVTDTKVITSSNVKWTSTSKLMKKLPPNTDQSSAHDMLFTSLPEKISHHRACQKVLKRGLYLGYLKLRSSVDLIRVLVAEKMPNVLPYRKIRENPHVSKEEWQWLQNLDANQVKALPTLTQIRFQEEIKVATTKLLDHLGISEDQAISHRLYDIEVIELSPEVTFLLLLPPAEDVCLVPGQADPLEHKQGFLSLPVQIYEMIHMNRYQKDFISRYSRLSILLEMNMLMAQHSQREAFSPAELATAREKLAQLLDFQVLLDDTWKRRRWIMDALIYARDKQLKGGIPLGVLYAPPPSPEDSPLSDHRIMITPTSSASQLSLTPVDDSAPEIYDAIIPQINLLDTDTKPSGILRIFAAYDTGLAKGASVKLHVTPRTTSREVINLVVQQLNKAAQAKGPGAPNYTDEQLNDFCLVAVIGSRERCLRDDYQPLQLQNPWTKGRLFVRLKTNLLAAIEQGNATAV